ncbi:MAG: exodeoxyribonuclease VII small subunit [Candidatus Promineifilaceae bacterium]
MQPDVADLTFETALQELEGIVGRLEGGDLTLEEALNLFERGQALATHCNEILEAAALKVEMLTGEGLIVELNEE